MAKLVVILGFAISFAAGLVVGMRADWSRLFGASVTPKQTTATTAPANAGGPDHSLRRPGRPGDRGPGGWLAAELDLTPEQHKQLDQIWSDLAERGRNRDHGGRRRALRNERDLAVAALIAPERWGEYEQIIDDFADRNAELDREFRADFDAGVERTKQILTPTQRAKYDTLLERHRWGPPGGDRGPRDNRRDGTRATSQPDGPNATRPSHGAQKGAQE